MLAPDMVSPLSKAAAWAVLRCQSMQTLTLADRLLDYGLAGWSPRLVVRTRIPRRRRTELKVVPLLPSFVFVPFPTVDDAVVLGVRGIVPRAWPFTFNGSRPCLPVGQLLAMDTTPVRSTGELFKQGERVRIIVGPMHGLTGTIVGRKGRDRWLVELDAGRRVLVPSFLIQTASDKTPPA